MITKQAKQRVKILNFWKKYGLKATKEAYSVGRSTLFSWWKIYKESNFQLVSLNPGHQAPHHTRQREYNHLILQEIRRLRLDLCPNMGKDKVKRFLDKYCKRNKLKIISASTIGRIIKDKKIYHHRQKVSHFGKIKIIKKGKKQRKPKGFQADKPGELIEVDTIVKFGLEIKRYIITAIDVNTRYAFALSYKRPTSSNAKDFFTKLETIFPYQIKNVQTDNGSEFHKYFTEYLKQRNINHFWNYKGQPAKNGHIEKYNRTLQEEFIDYHSINLQNTEKFNKELIDYLI
jgi:transposase InsO family protein